MADEERHRMLQEIREVLIRLPEKLLWDLRRMALDASSQDDFVPVQPFEKALSYSMRLLTAKDLEQILKELLKNEEVITNRVLGSLRVEYGTSDISQYVQEDLTKAAVKVWEALQVKSRSTRRWLAKQEYERVRWRLKVASPTLHEKLLERMVHVGCEKKYLVEAILDVVDRRISATRLAYKLSEQLKVTGRLPPDHPALCSTMPGSFNLAQRLEAVHRLLVVFEPEEAPAPTNSGPPPETTLIP